MLKFFPRKFHVISKKYLLAILCIVLLGIFFLNIYILPIIISISTDIIPTKTHKSIYANHGRSQEKSYESNSAALNFRYSTLLSKSLEYSNANHVILNTDRYSGVPTKRNTNFIIVVQVHDRVEYLKSLIDTLSRVKHIEKSILIFSHDYNSTEIIDVPQSISFCRVIQLFYPYSIQVFRDIFPGPSVDDCPTKISKEEAIILKCINWNRPDSYGHFRSHVLTQIKHHWWWKMNYVFDGIVKRYGLEEKYVMLLEEDYMVAPDLLHTLTLMEDQKQRFCPFCEVLCLGTYLSSYKNYESDIAQLIVEGWYSSKHNMGMALKLEQWEKISSVNCSKLFCSYDDYNWDWSLMSLSADCLKVKMRVLRVKSPRVIHIGDCGIHTHRCSFQNASDFTIKLFENMNSVYFPKNMQIVEVARKMLKPSKPNGGWGDPRDHQLCRLNTRPFGVLTNESGGKKRKIIPVSLLNDILSIRIPDN